MKTDLDYIKAFLSVFTESSNAHITNHDLSANGFKLDEDGVVNQKLLFHFQLILDQKLIGTVVKNCASNLGDLGITIDNTDTNDGELLISETQLRLTNKGQDFAKTLENNEVLAKLKSEFKDAPFNVIFEGGQKLLEHFFKKKLDALLAE